MKESSQESLIFIEDVINNTIDSHLNYFMNDYYESGHISEVALNPHNSVCLTNMGNTCYINSKVQEIFASSSLSKT